MQDFLIWGRILAGILVVVGIVLGTKARSAQRGGAAGSRLALIGILALCALQAYAIYGSPQTTVTGTVTHVQRTGGRHMHTEFDVTATDGTAHHLSMEDTGPNLKAGQAVSVTYLEYTSDISDLKVLQGPNQGWSIHEGTGNVGLLTIALAVVSLRSTCFGGQGVRRPRLRIRRAMLNSLSLR